MKFNLEERLIKYSASVHEVVDLLHATKGGLYLGNQLVASGTAPALLYGEALGAESRRDFIHKMKLSLKELRESLISLKIIKLKSYVADIQKVDELLVENNELISIFVKSIQTAKDNLKRELRMGK